MQMFSGENKILLSFMLNNSLQTIKRMFYLYFEKAEFKRVDYTGTFFYIICWRSFNLHISRNILMRNYICDINCRFVEGLLHNNLLPFISRKYQYLVRALHYKFCLFTFLTVSLEEQKSFHFVDDQFITMVLLVHALVSL